MEHISNIRITAAVPRCYIHHEKEYPDQR